MTALRYHLLSVIAVAVAMALGLFVGSGSPGQLSGTAQTTNLTHQSQRLNSQLSDVRARLRHAGAFEAAVAPFAVSGRLSGQAVVVVSAPGVDPSTRRTMIGMLTSAGATVTGDVRLRWTLLDARQNEFLTTLTQRLSVPGHPLPEGSGADRAVARLADVLGTRPGARPVPTATAASVLSAYSDGHLVTVNGGAARPGSLALLLVAAPTAGDAGQNHRAGSATLLQLASDLDTAAVGAVVAGPAAAAGPGGLLAAIRADATLSHDLSTVDGIEAPSGQVAAVFALAQQAEGQAGSYGFAAGDEAPVPSASAASTGRSR